jgi:hypothetical protein
MRRDLSVIVLCAAAGSLALSAFAQGPGAAQAPPADDSIAVLVARLDLEEVYCTKIGTTRPDEMYIVGAHMDGIGWGEAANDDGSGTALVMELARALSAPDVQTERSIRFAFWNNEETGLNGARSRGCSTRPTRSTRQTTPRRSART